LLVDRHDGDATSFVALLTAQSTTFTPIMRRGSDPFILIFTSGTTGRAKGVAAPLAALLQFAVFMEDGIDLQPSDVYWCFADPGWALGMYCTLTAPLLLGHATVLYEGSFTVEATVRIIAEAGVTNLVAAPTVFRMMRAVGTTALAPIGGSLRCITGGGEPLNPEISRWGASVLVPSPGFTFAVLDNDLRPVPSGTTGVLAVDRKRSPLFFFTGYWNADTPAFRGHWYLTGDTMRQDADGNLYFMGRNDDIITSAGYRIGPADVESAIIEHPSVAEVAVVGKPDAERTEIVKAFIVLRDGHQPDKQLTAEIQEHVRSRLSLHAYLREIEFLDQLPKTPSGKVQRFVLRQMDRLAAATTVAAPP
jgi:acetyl-CoA synthetase